MDYLPLLLKVLISLFIAVYLLYGWCWNLPDDRFERRVAMRWRKPYAWLGLWHGWTMFAPNPLAVNRRLEAQIEIAEGPPLIWRNSTLQGVPWWRAITQMRRRKMLELMEGNAFPFLRDAFCQQLIEEHRKPGQTPLAVTLVSVRELIPLPGEAAPAAERRLLHSYRNL